MSRADSVLFAIASLKASIRPERCTSVPIAMVIGSLGAVRNVVAPPVSWLRVKDFVARPSVTKLPFASMATPPR
ncbi:hypothetical protein GCM10008965_16600 [Methylorubrum aminovorans]